VYRILQEALGNIHRHSGSRIAKVSLVRSQNDVTLSVCDEGRGLPSVMLDPTPGAAPRLGVGIAGMRERVRQLGGTLEISSTSRGTCVKAVLPITERVANARESI
jgi:signal transduction histidine kinase